MRKLIPWGIAAALTLGLYHTWRQGMLVEQKTRLDTVYVERKVTQAKVQFVTDSILKTDTVFRDTTAKRIVADERRACDAVVSTCEKKVKNLEAQLKPGWLKIYGAGSYELPPSSKPLLNGTSSVAAGVSLRITRNLFLEGEYDRALTGSRGEVWRIRARKDLRIF
jgi:hypothetical protein